MQRTFPRAWQNENVTHCIVAFDQTSVIDGNFFWTLIQRQSSSVKNIEFWIRDEFQGSGDVLEVHAGEL